MTAAGTGVETTPEAANPAPGEVIGAAAGTVPATRTPVVAAATARSAAVGTSGPDIAVPSAIGSVVAGAARLVAIEAPAAGPAAPQVPVTAAGTTVRAADSAARPVADPTAAMTVRAASTVTIVRVVISSRGMTVRAVIPTAATIVRAAPIATIVRVVTSSRVRA